VSLRLTLLLVVSLLVAGCAGAAPDLPGGAPDADAPDVAAAGDVDTDAGSGDDFDGFDGSYDPYQFVPGTYVYDVVTPEGEAGRLVWTVADVGDDRVTVEASLETPSGAFETRVTGEREEAYGSFYATPLGPFVALGIASPVAAGFAEGDLSVGDRWSASGPDGSVVYRVERLDSFAGLDCAVVEYVVNDVVVYESCVAPEDAMTRHLVVRDGETGETVVEMTLVDHSA
jgi:hypothetical protein